MMSARQCCVENPEGRSFNNDSQCHTCIGKVSLLSNCNGLVSHYHDFSVWLA